MAQTTADLLDRLQAELETVLALEAQGATFPDDGFACDSPCDAPVANHRPSHQIRADIDALKETQNASD